MLPEILLVEDSPTQATWLRRFLEEQGSKVTVARNGREGINLATMLVPDIVVLDVNLPDIDGRRVCQALKDHPVTGDTPVIMLATRDGMVDTGAGLEARADAYIPKDDFTEDNLRQALRALDIL